ncbi:AGAP013484-PA-like protein [Anopheles sinensis]|uniref:AGAP013484-PA-like protein n=1 Tax=Anopheles sinensis TaxID=74873 RepID=A0A084WUS6_ANOSI|nr:AGAP013484-PA-like protein [Anopheles sinensis]
MRYIVVVTVFLLVPHYGRAIEININRNTSRPHSLKVNKYLCVGIPYKRTTVPYCKTILLRNKPAMFNVSVVVPEVLNYILVTMKLYYKYKTYQPFLIDLEQEGCAYMKNRPAIPLADYIYEIFKDAMPELAKPCPHGNRTYFITFLLEDRYSPNSMPAGDYRIDLKFMANDGVILFAVESYFSVRRSGVLPSMLDW